MSGTAQSAADALGAGPPSSVLTGTYGPGMVKSALGDIEQTQKQKEAAQAPVYARMQSDVTRDRARFEDIAKDYTPIEQTKAPPPPNEDPLAGFGSAASIFAALASSFTHTPAINAMNAMAGAITAQKQGDWKTYEAKYKEWKDNTEIAIKNHQLQAEDMKTAMDMMQSDLSTGVAMAKAVAAQSEDHIASKLLELGQYKDLADHQLASARAAASMQESAVRIQELHLDLADKRMDLQNKQTQQQLGQDLVAARQSGDPDKVVTATQALKDHFAATDANYLLRESGGNTPQAVALSRYLQQYPNATAEDIQKFVAGFKAPSPGAAKEVDAQTLALDKFHQLHDRPPTDADGAEMARLRISSRVGPDSVISDDAAKFVAGRVLAGDERATVGMARSNANMTKVANEIVALAKEQNISPNEAAVRIAEFQGTVSAERTLGTRAANMEVAANVVRGMTPTALETSAKVDRTQYPTLNSVILAADRHTGDENVVRFGQAANAIIYEYAKFLNPTGVPTDADKARATDILNTAWTQGQFAAALDQIVNKEIPAGAAGIEATRGEFRSGLGAKTTAVPGTGGDSSLPSEAKSKLVRGTLTHFGNGQVWTLDDAGQPKRVQ